MTPFWSAWSLKACVIMPDLKPYYKVKRNPWLLLPAWPHLTLLKTKKLQTCVGSDRIFSQKKSTKIFSFQIKPIHGNSSWHRFLWTSALENIRRGVAVSEAIPFVFQPWRTPIWAAFRCCSITHCSPPMETSFPVWPEEEQWTLNSSPPRGLTRGHFESCGHEFRTVCLAPV